MVLVTDGLPTLDLSNHAWPPLGSTAATGYGVTASFNPSPLNTLISTNDQALTDVMTEIAALQSIGVNTYIIGVGAGVDPAVNMTAYQTLNAMAVAGGTSAYFPANSPGAVTADLQIIITKILAATQSTASAAVNSTGLNTNSVVYQSQFTTSDLYQDWTGNLYAFPINPTTGVVNTAPSDALWSAQTQLDGQTWNLGRLIATWDPVAARGTPFQWNTGTPTTGIASSTVLGQDLETFTPDTNGQDVLQFLRGSNAQELRNGGQFRNRTHKLGDIVSSDPLYIGAPSSNNQTASYVAFAQTYASRPPMIYVGANDGMLHAFNATTGNELFAYIPTGAYANLTLLVNPYYNAVHQFYVNGSPQASDVQFSDNTLAHGARGHRSPGRQQRVRDRRDQSGRHHDGRRARQPTCSGISRTPTWASDSARPRSPTRPTAGRCSSATATTAAIRSPSSMRSTRRRAPPPSRSTCAPP